MPWGNIYAWRMAHEQRPDVLPAQGRYLWIDQDGDGRPQAEEVFVPEEETFQFHPSFWIFVDANLDLWIPYTRQGIYHLPRRGFSEDGVPIYDLEDERLIAKPSEFISIDRVIYDPGTDIMILTGDTWDHPGRGGEGWGQSGREAIRYDDWSKETRRVVSRMPFPGLNIKSVTVAPAAGLLFAGEMETMTLFTYDLQTGELLGIIEPNSSVVGSTGWIDVAAGIRAFERSCGEVMILCEEVYFQKQLVYRLAPEDIEAARQRLAEAALPAPTAR